MTIAATKSIANIQHLVLDGVSWSFYEHVLEEIGDRPMRVTFDNGSIEIMAPLQEHESPKTLIGRMVEMTTFELDIEIKCLGSTTLRREDLEKGLEPDECYYVQNVQRVRDMKSFDPAIYPAPDLAIEVDITRRSIARQPIYAGLGVPELWRFDGKKIGVLLLSSGDRYLPADSSMAFPFLPMTEFNHFLTRLVEESSSNAVLRDFQKWLQGLRSNL